MNPPPEQVPKLARNVRTATKKLFDKLKKQPPRNLDDLVHTLHENVFAQTDCLTCANCCKTTSPIFYQKDIERVAHHLRMKPGRFMEQYLHLDEDQDYVLNTAPCPFLSPDNTCQVYSSRPTACREYPHTNRRKFHQLLDLTMKNAAICPAVFTIVERLKKIIAT